MKRLRWRFPAALAAMLLLVPACVELTGQRITWFYDAAADTLRLLIHYDGIHESDTSPTGGLFSLAKRKGAEQIPKFVENGDVMILGWFLYLDRNRLREAAAESSDPLIIRAAELSRTIETRTLGFYREPDGRIGAAQMISIPRASEFFRQVNDLISRALLVGREREPDPAEMPRTMQRIWEAARTDHQWIAINGHSLRVSLPVHPGEWSQARAAFVADLFDQVIREMNDLEEDAESGATTLVQLINSAPISYIDEGDRVTFVLGRPDQPSTLRLAFPQAYEPSLEEIVTETVAFDLDEALSRSLLYPGTGLPQHLAPLLQWGPPEDRVRAMLTQAGDSPVGLRSSMAEHLARWGEQWNQEGGVPPAPSELDPIGFVTEWARWYEQIKNPGR